ncbi:L-glutamine synthetase [Nitzschia inconspicua]|uniref:glutaminase n=1 Tax=Nitzschia inconspicua TaxID=303405 RepID=A0A9K3PW21_9STRA|nr:L-glutamine synthetase [Nitzschia inconspicua]
MTPSTTTASTTSASSSADPRDASDKSDDNVIPAVTCRDILIELFWYIKQKTVARSGTEPSQKLLFQDIVWSLEQEGILFWRDRRYHQSQQVAIRWLSENSTTNATAASSHDKIQQQVGVLPVSYSRFVDLVSPCATLFLKAFNEEHVIPDWTSFVSDMQIFFDQAAKDTSGQNAQYIPILRDANPDLWGISFCSVDGQRWSVGDASVKFSLQSVCKPVTYAIGLATEGTDFMEQWIDVEPAGRPFNTQDLDPATQRPFNASLNSGAIMAAGVVASAFPPATEWKEIVDHVRAKWQELCGQEDVGFSMETFESEKATAYNNFAIAYNLKGRRGLPRDVDLHKMLDVYLGCCSIEITAEALSVVAATLANGGICPITGKEVFPALVVRTVLAETMTCGLYDQAGHFAVEVGLPAKSGVSGAILVMVPGVFGFCTFSPRLNAKGNSVRGIDFCKRLVNCYRLHIFEPESGNNGVKIDPRKNGWKDEQKKISHLAWAASVGDENAIRLRDIFLLSLYRTATASEEGLSEKKKKIIQEKYEQVFLTELDTVLAESILTRANKCHDLTYLENLLGHTYVTDAIKEIIFNAMIEIAMSDDVMGKEEKNMAIRISRIVLGMSEDVARLELGRYEKHVGHRFEGSEIPDLIENVKSSILGPVGMNGKKPERTTSIGSLGGMITKEEEDILETYDHREDAFRLRKSLLKLGQRLSKISGSKK